MLRRFRVTACLVLEMAFLFLTGSANAQVKAGQNTRPLVTQGIDENKMVTRAGNTRPEAVAKNDRGRVADDFPMEMMLQLQLPTEKEQELEQLIHDLENPGSPRFHKWLSGDQFRQQFSLAPQDVEVVTSWLQSQGFKVNFIYPRSIDFSGTAGQVRNAFRTEIHNLEVEGEKHFANMSDPRIPAALAPAVAGVVSLHNFMPRPQNIPRSQYTIGGGFYLVVPADLATIYNLNPLFMNGNSGQGQTIVLLERSNVYSTADWTTFRTTLGLSGFSSGSFTQVHPPPGTGVNACTDPGVGPDD
jgi:subtilase family serine protease